ncbi:MAG: hypothetical protein ACM3QZ_03910 [Solirubrobacterales bacterium]
MGDTKDSDRLPKTWADRMRTLWSANYNQSMNVLSYWDNLFRAAFEQNYKASEEMIRLGQQSIEEMRDQSDEMIEMMRQMSQETADCSQDWSPEKSRDFWTQFLKKFRSF